MPATQVPAHPAVAEEIQDVLSACQYAWNGRDYACQLVLKLAALTDSPYAVWLNWPLSREGIVAQTENLPSPECLLSLCERAPLLRNDLENEFGIHSMAAAPVILRSSMLGVLAVANGARPYAPAVLDLLAGVGRTALVEYECREHAACIGLTGMPQRMAHLVHRLRQPLGNLEASLCFLELVLPAAEPRVNEQIAKMQAQLDLVGEIINEAVQGYARRKAPEAESLVLANSAMSMVT